MALQILLLLTVPFHRPRIVCIAHRAPFTCMLRLSALFVDISDAAQGITPVEFAVVRGHPEVVKLLLDKTRDGEVFKYLVIACCSCVPKLDVLKDRVATMPVLTSVNMTLSQH